MVLVLSRGRFCPKEPRPSELLLQLHREIEVAYSHLVTISTDNIAQTVEFRSGAGAHWPFLSGAGRVVQKDLDTSSPELRTAWQNGRKELCYPYGKKFTQTVAEQD